ncbi:MAG: Ig-like domain-containing protein [Chloroflexota bacterium]
MTSRNCDNVAVSGMSATGTVIATIPANAATDAAGNGSVASTSTDNTVTFYFNVTPIAGADTYATTFQTALTVPAPGVLTNDIEPLSRPLTATTVSQPAHGVLQLGANGGFTYTPNAGFVGTDTFTYRAANPDGNGANATVTISAQAGQTVPNGGLLLIKLDADANTLVDLPPGMVAAYPGGVTGLSGVLNLKPAHLNQDFIFTVRRKAPGAFTTSIVVLDSCGEWRTFVGGGQNIQ